MVSISRDFDQSAAQIQLERHILPNKTTGVETEVKLNQNFFFHFTQNISNTAPTDGLISWKGEIVRNVLLTCTGIFFVGTCLLIFSYNLTSTKCCLSPPPPPNRKMRRNAVIHHCTHHKCVSIHSLTVTTLAILF
jgi:hypothetical protein